MMCHFQKEHVVQVCMKIIITDMRTRSLKTVNTSLMFMDYSSCRVISMHVATNLQLKKTTGT